MSPNESADSGPRPAIKERHEEVVAVSEATNSGRATGKVPRPDSNGGKMEDETKPRASSQDLIDLTEDNKPTESPESPPSLQQNYSAGLEEAPDIMTASVATLKAPQPGPPTATAGAGDSGLLLSPDRPIYVDPTPPTPLTSSRTPSRAASAASRSGHSRTSSEASPTRSDAAYDERRYTSEDEQDGGSRSEIQSIMLQFDEEGGGPGEAEVMSPRLEITSPHMGSTEQLSAFQHPPRKSSLEPLAPSLSGSIQDIQSLRLSSTSPSSVRSKEKASEDQGPPVPPKDSHHSYMAPSLSHDDRQSIESPMSPAMLHRPPPPEPEPEPDLPFDFHRFLEQLRNKKADPVARYLKSFLSEFGKKQWMVHEQVKIVSDFLAFIANKMAQCEVWKNVSDTEFDNAREGMEKLVMNRLYSQTFSPAIPPPQPIPGAKPRRRGGENSLGPGRKGQHQEDVERDEILTQKINIYGWVREAHLDIPPVNDSGKRFLKLAQQEILKIKTYRAPRDKIICVLNCCKVIFGLLKNSKSDTSADSFMPLLIYVVLQANPEHLVSNVQYILRFRNQEKLGGEAGYYLSSLMGAVQFIENMDRTTLTISDDEFERNVEAAVSAIAEKHRPQTPPSRQPELSEKPKTLHAPGGEASGRRSLEAAEQSTHRRSLSNDATGAVSGTEDQAVVGSLLRTIQKPLTTIGRIFSDESGTATPLSGTTAGSGGARTPARNPSPRRSTDRPPSSSRRGEEVDRPSSRSGGGHTLSAEEAAARQASAESAEAQRLHRAEHANVVETLAGMFPDLDKDIISDVVYQKQGRVGLAVDACLALSA